MSAKNTKALKKKADDKGFTLGSLKREFCKGKGAYYSSGSRPGQTPESWAHARVNKAMADRPAWAIVKKRGK